MFVMEHLLADLNQFCTHDAPGVKTGPSPGGGGGFHNFEHGNKKGKPQNSSLKLEGVELSYLIYSISLWTFINFIHMIPLGSKLAHFGVTRWNNSNKKGRIHFVGKMTQVSDPGPSWPFYILIISETTLPIFTKFH